jgi:hypothetical protein
MSTRDEIKAKVTEDLASLVAIGNDYKVHKTEQASSRYMNAILIMAELLKIYQDDVLKLQGSK